jgi:hypothetical protein
MGDSLTVKEAAEFASSHIQKNVTPSNISYLVYQNVNLVFLKIIYLGVFHEISN